MTPEQDKKLCDTFPLLYRDRHCGVDKTCMGWGFCVGSGWFDIIWRLSEKLEPLIAEFEKDNPEDSPIRMAQCKEKFGVLRVYLTTGTDKMFRLVDEAEAESETVCENCGAPGTVGGNVWVSTLCDSCRKDKK